MERAAQQHSNVLNMQKFSQPSHQISFSLSYRYQQWAHSTMLTGDFRWPQIIGMPRASPVQSVIDINDELRTW
ncbi:MAG: hypothetical protein LKF41_02610 [Bifidobacterium sp.]|nr:hypothetical protein [Bifidobacterium sp.]MCH4174736.1 hypothetical protein [Bifidobacterium sp.]